MLTMRTNHEMRMHIHIQNTYAHALNERPGFRSRHTITTTTTAHALGIKSETRRRRANNRRILMLLVLSVVLFCSLQLSLCLYVPLVCRINSVIY